VVQQRAAARKEEASGQHGSAKAQVAKRKQDARQQSEEAGTALRIADAETRTPRVQAKA